MQSNNYKQKYLKYKNKYLNLVKIYKMKGGMRMLKSYILSRQDIVEIDDINKKFLNKYILFSHYAKIIYLLSHYSQVGIEHFYNNNILTNNFSLCSDDYNVVSSVPVYNIIKYLYIMEFKDTRYYYTLKQIYYLYNKLEYSTVMKSFYNDNVRLLHSNIKASISNTVYNMYKEKYIEILKNNVFIFYNEYRNVPFWDKENSHFKNFFFKISNKVPFYSDTYTYRPYNIIVEDHYTKIEFTNFNNSRPIDFLYDKLYIVTSFILNGDIYLYYELKNIS